MIAPTAELLANLPIFLPYIIRHSQLNRRYVTDISQYVTYCPWLFCLHFGGICAMSSTLQKLGLAIKKQRGLLGYSQEKLADQCDFDRTYISMLERGKRNPSLLNLVRLSEGLGISLSKLIEEL
jgi:DNA-binding XRE family transcriptional regulator